MRRGRGMAVSVSPLGIMGSLGGQRSPTAEGREKHKATLTRRVRENTAMTIARALPISQATIQLRFSSKRSKQ